MFKNTAAKFRVYAFDSTTSLPKTGDAANITAYVSKDYGTVTVLADTSASEEDATNAKGYYLFDAAQGETNADCLMVSAKSSTSNIVVIGAPAVIFTRPQTGWLAPTTAGRTLDVSAGGEAGVDWANVGSPTTTLGLTGTTIATSQVVASVSGNVTGSVGSVLGGIDTTSGTTKTLDALQTALNSAHGSGSWATATGFSTLTAAQVATGVWQDTTAGDFTVASSIGKALYISNVAPGGAGGHMIAGSNAATTFATLTVTGATSLAALSTSGTATFNALTVTNATTLSGAVSLGSTLTVTGATSLAALSMTTLTASGAVALQSTLIVTGATTFTGAVTADNASNSIKGAKLASTGLDLVVPTDPTTIPVAGTSSIVAWIGYFGIWSTAEVHSTNSLATLRNHAGSLVASHSLSDDGTTFVSDDAV